MIPLSNVKDSLIFVNVQAPKIIEIFKENKFFLMQFSKFQYFFTIFRTFSIHPHFNIFSHVFSAKKEFCFFNLQKMWRLFHILARLRPTARTFLIALAIIVLTIITWMFLAPDVKDAKQCFHLKSINDDAYRTFHINFFDDMMESKKMPTPGKSIFFHETSCSTDGLVHLNAR